MARVDMTPERLSDYERAVCYYTLPRVIHPVTFSLVVVYTICLLEALGVLTYGLLWNKDSITQIGAIALAGIVVLGIVAFTLRALKNEVTQRRLLAMAHNAPDAESNAQDVPDPFADHILLRHPLHNRGDLFPCTDRDGKLAYFVESAGSSPWWRVRDAQDNEVIRVHILATASSFSFTESTPSQLAVCVGEEEVARLKRRFSFSNSAIHMDCSTPEPRKYVFRGGGLYRDKRLVGRIYHFHKSLYLDIEKAEFHEAILGLFVTMS